MAAMEDEEANRYRENCSLFSIPPNEAFEMALRSKSESCDLSNQGIDDNAMVCIAESLRSSAQITDLDISGNQITETGAQDFASALSENRSVRNIKLRDNNLGDAGVAAIFSSLLENPASQLECVDCRSTGLTSAGLPKVMGALGVNPTITALNLESNGLTGEAGGAIASALRRNRALRVLCLGFNYLGDAGIAAISQALAEGSPLTLLDISRNGVCVEGATAIATAIRSPSFTVSELLLAYNPLSTLGCQALAAAISDRCLATPNPHDFPLRYMDATGVDGGIPGLDALAQASAYFNSQLAEHPDPAQASGESFTPIGFQVDGLDGDSEGIGLDPAEPIQWAAPSRRTPTPSLSQAGGPPPPAMMTAHAAPPSSVAMPAPHPAPAPAPAPVPAPLPAALPPPQATSAQYQYPEGPGTASVAPSAAPRDPHAPSTHHSMASYSSDASQLQGTPDGTGASLTSGGYPGPVVAVNSPAGPPYSATSGPGAAPSHSSGALVPMPVASGGFMAPPPTVSAPTGGPGPHSSHASVLAPGSAPVPLPQPSGSYPHQVPAASAQHHTYTHTQPTVVPVAASWPMHQPPTGPDYMVGAVPAQHAAYHPPPYAGQAPHHHQPSQVPASNGYMVPPHGSYVPVSATPAANPGSIPTAGTAGSTGWTPAHLDAHKYVADPDPAAPGAPSSSASSLTLQPPSGQLAPMPTASQVAALQDQLQKAVAGLANELRWIDEEGLKSRLEAEAELRSRVDELASRVDSLEDSQQASMYLPSTPGRHRSGRRGGDGNDTPGAPIPRETLAKHVRSNEERVIQLENTVDELRRQLSSVQDTVRTLQLHTDAIAALERKQVDDEGLQTAPPSDDLSTMITRTVSSQLGAVTSKLKGEVDKAVGLAMQTVQRTVDTGPSHEYPKQFASLTRRLDVLEQTVTAEQEMSLNTLEVIMRATNRGGPLSPTLRSPEAHSTTGPTARPPQHLDSAPGSFHSGPSRNQGRPSSSGRSPSGRGPGSPYRERDSRRRGTRDGDMSVPSGSSGRPRSRHHDHHDRETHDYHSRDDHRNVHPSHGGRHHDRRNRGDFDRAEGFQGDPGSRHDAYYSRSGAEDTSDFGHQGHGATGTGLSETGILSVTVAP